MSKPVVLERYALAEWLGGGTFSEVYRAQDLRTGQDVAIKFLRSAQEHATAAQTTAFQRELRLCSRLNHPNIVGLMDCGEDPDGRLFAVFQLVPGETLAHHLARVGQLPVRVALRWMGQVLDALVCAHRALVIHRDLKPSNILIHPAGATAQAMVVDFGIGGVTGEPGSERQPGTLAYAAPEQLGDGAVSAVSDLFSWALIMLECLTGRQTLDGTTVQEVAFRKLSQSAVELPAALETQPLGRLLRQLLHKEPSRRPQSAAEVMQELSEGVAGSEESIRILEWWQQRGRSQRRPTLVASGSADNRPQRRWCTLIVIDRVGVPGPSDDWDEASLVASARDIAVESVRQHGGFMSAADFPPFVACYGWLSARPNEASHAADSALDIAAKLVSSWGPASPWRIAVTSGPVERTARGRPLMGMTAYQAMRLTRTAPDASVWLDGLTAELLQSDFSLVAIAGDSLPSGAVALLDRPVMVGAAAQTEAQDALGAELVGRQRELSWLGAHWQHARGGVGACVLLSGDAGVGKTALLDEMIRRIGRVNMDLWRVDCRAQSAPLAAMLSRRIGLSGGEATQQRERTLRRFVDDVGLDATEGMPLLKRLLDPVSSAPDVAPPLDSERIGLMIDLIFELSAQRPLLLLVDNAEEASPALQHFLERLVNEVDTAAILLVVLAQSSFVPSFNRAKTSVMPLAALSREGVQALAQSRLKGDGPLSEDAIDELLALSAGRPGLIVELLRYRRTDPAAQRLPRAGSAGSWLLSPRLCQTLSAESLAAEPEALLADFNRWRLGEGPGLAPGQGPNDGASQGASVRAAKPTRLA